MCTEIASISIKVKVEQCSLTTVLQISNTGTDVMVVTKNASVVVEAVGVDVLLLDLGGPPNLVVYAVQL